MRSRPIALLLCLYFVQGLPYGFQVGALPVYLRAHGVSLTGISFASALSLPWLLKALWAPLVDRFGSERFGHRRSWIFPLQLCLAATSAAAAFVAPERALWPLLALVFAMNLFAATQDIAVDGLAVDLLTERELGPGNAAQVVGYKLGMLAGGGLLVAASRFIGWSGLFACISVSCLLAAIVTLGFGEPLRSRPSDERETLGDVLRALKLALRLPGAAWLLVVVGTYKLGESMHDAMFKPFLVDAGFADWRIGLWVGTYGTVASLIGSAMGGALAAGVFFRRRENVLWRALAIAALLRVGPLVLQWAMVASGTPSAPAVVAVTLAEHFFGGMLTTAMFAFMMSRVERSIGATHYTLLASIEVLGKSPAGLAAGPIADAWGYGPVFAAGVALSLAYLPLLWAMRRSGAVAGALPDR